MLAAFRNLSLLGRAISVICLIAGVSGLVAGAYAFVRHQGYVEGEAAARARCEAEKEAQRRANQQAVDAASRSLVRLNDQLITKTQELQDAHEALAQAAAADPLGARECLGLDSVRRLAPIR